MSYGMAASLAARLCFAAPMLYLGVLMATDPAAAMETLASAARGIRNFGSLMAGFAPPPVPARDEFRLTHPNLMRAAGIATCVAAVTPLLALPVV